MISDAGEECMINLVYFSTDWYTGLGKNLGNIQQTNVARYDVITNPSVQQHGRRQWPSDNIFLILALSTASCVVDKEFLRNKTRRTLPQLEVQVSPRGCLSAAGVLRARRDTLGTRTISYSMASER